ncbi:hypothetical protein Ciccas_011956 [Cichlidogyrus casuarinus]|uniref:Dolichyl-diphosphooligosaccharide--protein glycosyltransferase subunit 2 n=1 Tax=Cichlidogyrus casuarinus TaxID=1844966 RepID=A0ABD2PPS5_9PLAT
MILNAFLIFCLVSVSFAKLRTEFDPKTEKIYVEVIESVYSTSNNAENLYYASKSLAFLNHPVKVNCAKQLIEATNEDSKLIQIAHLTTECPTKQLPEAAKIIADNLENPANLRDLYFAIVAAQATKTKIDGNMILATLNALRDPSSPISNGYAFNIAVLASLDKTKITGYHSAVEKILGSILTINDEMAFYDGGAVNTAIIVGGIIDLEAHLGKPNSISNDLMMKFSNYFFSQKLALSDPKAWWMSFATLQKLLKLAKSTPVVLFNPNGKTKPFSIGSLSDQVTIGYGSIWPAQKEFKSKIDLKVIAILDKVTKNPAIEGSDFGTCKSSKVGECQLKLTAKDLQPGAYDLVLSLARPDASAFMPKSTLVPLILRGSAAQININSLKISAGSASHEVKPSELPLKNKLVLNEEDKFVLTLGTDSKLLQSSVVFEGKFHTIPFILNYIARKSDKNYIFDIRSDQLLKDSLELGGTFKVTAYLGTSKESEKLKPMKLELCELEVLPISVPPARSDYLQQRKLPSHELTDYEFSVAEKANTGAGEVLSTTPFALGELSNEKRKLEHTFREPDIRAGASIALLFTGICLCPLAILVIGWPLVGMSLRPPISLAVPIFHGGLLGMFVIYGMYWLKFNMFQTLKYLTLVGVPTFLAGSSLLRTLVNRR